MFHKTITPQALLLFIGRREGSERDWLTLTFDRFATWFLLKPVSNLFVIIAWKYAFINFINIINLRNPCLLMCVKRQTTYMLTCTCYEKVVQIFSHRIVLHNVLFCASTATRNHVISVALPGHVGRCNFCPRVCGIYYDFYVCCWVSSFYIILNCMAWNYRTDPFLVFMRSYFEGHF